MKFPDKQTILKWLIPTLLVFIAGLVIFKLTHPGSKVSTNNVANLIKLQSDTTTHHKDSESQVHAEREVITDPNQALILTVYKHQIDSISHRLNIAQSTIKAFGEIHTQTEQVLKPKVVYVDSSRKNLSIYYRDPWIDLNGTMDLTNLNTTLDYKGRDSLHYVFHTSHQNIFQKLITTPNLLMDVSSSNPHTRIPYIQGVLIPPTPDSHFKFGFYSGYGLQLNTKNSEITTGPQVGAGITYKF